MSSCSVRLRKIRGTALLLAVLSVLVVLVSAYIRLDGAGLGCIDWPACYGQVLTSKPQIPQFGFGIARLLHRITASVALVLACFLAWHCLRPQPIQPVARFATLLLILMLALSALGILSADPRRALVGFLNIVGGLGLVILSWRVVLSANLVPQPEPEPLGQRSLLLRLGAVALSVTVMLGAWIGASYAALSCSSVPDCAGIWWPPIEGWSAFNLLITLQSAALPGDAGGLALNLLHRYSAAITIFLLGIAGVNALAHGARRNAARVMLLLLVVELALGWVTVASGLSLWLTIGHGIGAAALLAAVVTLLRK